jgi:hypothetical protein
MDEEETQSQQKSIIKKEKEIKTTKTLSRTTKTERKAAWIKKLPIKIFLRG